MKQVAYIACAFCVFVSSTCSSHTTSHTSYVTLKMQLGFVLTPYYHAFLQASICCPVWKFHE